MANRIDRISEEIKKEVSNIIQNELKDPRLPEIVSVTHVKTTKDLRYCKVYVSILGGQEEKNGAMEALNNSTGYIRREIGKRINLRYTPEITIQLDESIERGVYLTKLIDETIKGN